MKDPMDTAPRWPQWKDLAPQATSSSSRVELGLRTTGTYKHSEPGSPLISYVTVVRNAEHTIARTIQSVQDQSYRNVEHVIIDGASRDKTLEIIKSYQDRIDYVLSEPDSGLYDALNKAIEYCRGDLICVLNADDWLMPNAARIIASIHTSKHDNAYMILSSALIRTGQTTQTWQPNQVNSGSYFVCANACHNAIYASRLACERAGAYDASYKIAGDFKWIMQAADAKVDFIYSDLPTVNYSPGGLSSDTSAHSLECVRLIQERFKQLSTEECWGLYHAFHEFRRNTKRFATTHPENLTAFLESFCQKHSTETELIAALALAAIPRMTHNEELEKGRKKISRAQKIKNSIRKKYNRIRAII